MLQQLLLPPSPARYTSCICPHEHDNEHHCATRAYHVLTSAASGKHDISSLDGYTQRLANLGAEQRNMTTVQPALAAWVGQGKGSSNLRLSVDIDPQSFL